MDIGSIKTRKLFLPLYFTWPLTHFYLWNEQFIWELIYDRMSNTNTKYSCVHFSIILSLFRRFNITKMTPYFILWYFRLYKMSPLFLHLSIEESSIQREWRRDKKRDNIRLFYISFVYTKTTLNWTYLKHGTIKAFHSIAFLPFLHDFLIFSSTSIFRPKKNFYFLKIYFCICFSLHLFNDDKKVVHSCLYTTLHILSRWHR